MKYDLLLRYSSGIQMTDARTRTTPTEAAVLVGQGQISRAGLDYEGERRSRA
jgi:hypothetical protein